MVSVGGSRALSLEREEQIQYASACVVVKDWRRLKVAVPSRKDKAMEELIDGHSKETYGRTRTESIRADICVVCGEPATEFRDELSVKEYTISGACQKCQDKVFGE